MIKIENDDVHGFKAAIRGMRNPMNSWDKSDSGFKPVKYPGFEDIRIEYVVGEADLKLMKSLVKAGNDHAKFMRFIMVSCDITAPLYWWKEFDTYKVGTVANSCSTMHKIHAKKFELDDFSHEHLIDAFEDSLIVIINDLNDIRDLYVNYESYDIAAINPDITCKKDLWWQMIQLLPSSYNQRRTILLNYQVLKNIFQARKNHKLDEWRDLCEWVRGLPYSELITGEENND